MNKREGSVSRLRIQNTALWVTLIAGVGLLLAGLIPSDALSGRLQPTVANLVSAFLGAGVVGLLWEYANKESFANELRLQMETSIDEALRRAGVAQVAETEGIIAVTRDFHHGIRWAEYLSTAKSVDVCWWSGRLWFSTYFTQISALIKESPHPVALRVAIPDVSNPRVRQQMALDSGLSEEVICAAHYEALDILGQFPESKVELSLIPRVPRYMYLRMGDIALFGVYGLAAGRNIDRPTIVCKSDMPLGKSLSIEFEAILSQFG